MQVMLSVNIVDLKLVFVISAAPFLLIVDICRLF